MKTMNKLFFLFSFFYFLTGNAQPCWKTISAGGDKVMALKNDGKVWGWGDNGQGGLGLSAFTGAKLIPTQSSNTSVFTQIESGGNQFTIAIKNDGTLWATGANTYGFLGNGNTTNQNSFVQIGNDTNWQSISAGGSHSLAIKTDGTLWAWGANNDGQLGNGTNIDSNIPIQIGIDTNWQSVSAGGYYFSAAIKTDGTLWVWGNDSFGQMANGPVTLHQNTPTKIGLATDWKSVSAGQYHCLATKTDNSLWGWGENSSGNLGIGTTSSVPSPIQVGVAADWDKISAGNMASYAIKSNGTIWAWGYNSNGQLGDNSTTQKTIPTQIGNATDWQMVNGAKGSYYATALKTDGSAWAWGINNFGVLGDGTLVDKHIPNAIACPTLKENEFEKTSISLYPNPSNGIFNIAISEKVKAITAFDVLGKEILVKSIANNQFLIEKSGLYFLKIELENRTIMNSKICIKQ